MKKEITLTYCDRCGYERVPVKDANLKVEFHDGSKLHEIEVSDLCDRCIRILATILGKIVPKTFRTRLEGFETVTKLGEFLPDIVNPPGEDEKEE